jgi:hypothetical protein
VNVGDCRYELGGLDGSNLLAFLAAIGALRVLTLARTDNDVPRLGWSNDGGVWRPVLCVPDCRSLEELLSIISRFCCNRLVMEIDSLAAQICMAKDVAGKARGKDKRIRRAELKALEKQRDGRKKELDDRRIAEAADQERAEACKKTFKEATTLATKATKELRSKIAKLSKKSHAASEGRLRSELALLRDEADLAQQAWSEALAKITTYPAFSLGDEIAVLPSQFAAFAGYAASDSSPQNRG